MDSSAEATGLPGPKLPKTFRAFVTKFPEIGGAHEQVAQAAEQAGPLDRKTCELIKIGIPLVRSGVGNQEPMSAWHFNRARRPPRSSRRSCWA